MTTLVGAVFDGYDAPTSTGVYELLWYVDGGVVAVSRLRFEVASTCP